MNEYGLIEVKERYEWGKRWFYIYQGDPSMKNWIGIVEFEGKNFKIFPFRKEQSFTEQIELCRLCSEQAQKMD